MRFNGTNRHWFIIGAEFPVGQYLAELAGKQALPYSSRLLDSQEPITLPIGASASPLAIIAIAGETPELVARIKQWIALLIDHDIPMVLLSSAKVFKYNEVGSLESDEMTGEQDLIDLENQARKQLRHLILRVNQMT